MTFLILTLGSTGSLAETRCVQEKGVNIAFHLAVLSLRLGDAVHAGFFVHRCHSANHRQSSLLVLVATRCLFIVMAKCDLIL